MNPEEVLDIYISLKLHFTQDRYNYFTYHGKTKHRKKEYDDRADRGHIFRLSRKYRKDDFLGFVISNLLKDPQIWPGSLNTPEADQTYKDWLKFNNSLTYNVVKELKELKDKGLSLGDLLRVEGGQHPKLLKEFYANNIHLETLIVLVSLMDIMPVWSKKISDTVIWPETKRIMIKYAPFLKTDIGKLKKEIYGVFKCGESLSAYS